MSIEKNDLDLSEIKSESEKIILSAGGKICNWLPELEYKGIKSAPEIMKRASVLNALINVAFEAPTYIIKEWIKDNKLYDELTEKEKSILEKQTNELSQQEKIDLAWYIESLWALLWVGQIITELPFDEPVADYAVELVPNLEKGEDNSIMEEKMKSRTELEIYKMADLYYRLHWYTADAGLNRYSTGRIDGEIIMERRRALSWAINPDYKWDEINMNT